MHFISVCALLIITIVTIGESNDCWSWPPDDYGCFAWSFSTSDSCEQKTCGHFRTDRTVYNGKILCCEVSESKRQKRRQKWVRYAMDWANLLGQKDCIKRFFCAAGFGDACWSNLSWDPTPQPGDPKFLAELLQAYKKGEMQYSENFGNCSSNCEAVYPDCDSWYIENGKNCYAFDEIEICFENFKRLEEAWTYEQSTGRLRHNGTDIGTGYSGNGVYKNEPSYQNIKGRGPIPRGQYSIGPAYYHNGTHPLGPVTMNLTPTGSQNMFGRDLFCIHGDSTQHPGNGSDGCIVLGPTIRKEINASEDHVLVVFP